MPELETVTRQAQDYLASTDPATQVADMQALASLFVPLTPDEATSVAKTSLGTISFDDRHDLFPELARQLTGPQLLGVARGLDNPQWQVELLRTAAATLSTTQAMVVLAQSEIDAQYLRQGPGPTSIGERAELVDLIASSLGLAQTAGTAGQLDSAGEAANQVADKIVEVGGTPARVTVLPVLYAADGEQGGIGRTALFRVEGLDGRPHLVDEQGLDYENTDDYRDNNNLPAEGVTLAMPLDGRYETDDAGHVRLLVDDARREGWVEQFRRETHADLVVGGVALVATGALLVAGSSLALPAAAVVTAKALLAGGGVYGMAVSVDSAQSQLSHGSGLTLQVGLDITNGVLAGAGLAEVSAAGRAAGLFTPQVRAGLLAGNLAAGGVGVWNFAANAGRMSDEQVRVQALMLALNVAGMALSVAGPRLLQRMPSPDSTPASSSARAPGESLADRRVPKPGSVDTISFDAKQVAALIQAAKEGRPLPELDSRSAATNGELIKFVRDEEVLNIYATSSSRTLEQGSRPNRLEVRYSSDGRAVIQQQGIKACTAAASGMLIVDNGGVIDIRAQQRRTTSDLRTAVPDDIEAAGLQSVVTSLRSIDDLANALAANGPAVVGLDTELGGHAVVVDAVNLSTQSARIRDPWHGWDIQIPLASLERRLNFAAGNSAAVQVLGGRPGPRIP